MLTLFVFYDTATTEIYTYRHTLSLHDALPIYPAPPGDTLRAMVFGAVPRGRGRRGRKALPHDRLGPQRQPDAERHRFLHRRDALRQDRKSTRLNTSP